MQKKYWKSIITETGDFIARVNVSFNDFSEKANLELTYKFQRSFKLNSPIITGRVGVIVLE